MRRRVQKSVTTASVGAADTWPALPGGPTVPVPKRPKKPQSLVPALLTVEAVKSKQMPEFGKSGLPSALESAIPPQYRYWLAKSADEARGVRDALVEAAIITQENLLLVDGEPRRVMKRTFLVEEEGEAPLSAQLPEGQFAATCLEETEQAVVVYEREVSPKLEELAKMASEPAPWIAVYEDSQVVQAALLAANLSSVFKVATRAGSLYASNVAVASGNPFAEQLVAAKKSMAVRLLKKAKEEQERAATEERFIYGIVLEPETRDYQDDIYSAEEIRTTAHGFMEGYRAGRYVAHQHDGEDLTGQLLVLESFIAPVDFEVDGEQVKKGSWVMAMRVLDDELWEAVKKGEITGYSIGGDAIRTPDTGTASA